MLGPVSLICVGVSAGKASKADRGGARLDRTAVGDYNSGCAGSARVREGVLKARSMAAMVVTCGLVETGRGRVIRCACV